MTNTTNPLRYTDALALETEYNALLARYAAVTAKEWNQMGNKLADASKRLVCVDATTSRKWLSEKADDCYEASRKAARGSHEIFPHRPE